MALITKNKLISKGILPFDANKLAIEFIKERGEKIIVNVVNKFK